MAFGDLIRTETASLEDVATKLEALLLTCPLGSESGTVSTTSTSYTQLGTLSLTVSVPSGGLVIVRAHIPFSIGSTTHAGYFGISEDSTSAILSDEVNLWPELAKTSGFNQQASFVLRSNPSAGNHTYRILWKVDSGGTVYSGSRRIMTAEVYAQ